MPALLRMKTAFLPLLLAVCLGCVIAAAEAAAAADETAAGYSLGIMLREDGAWHEQMKTAGKALFDGFAGRHGLQYSLHWYADRETFLKSVKEARHDFLVLTENHHLPGILTAGDSYELIAAGGLFGEPRPDLCLYVPADSGISSIEQLRGATASIYAHEYPYYSLHELLGTDPSSFFGELIFEHSGVASLYNVDSGIADVSFARSHNIDGLRMTNPVLAGNMKPLRCSRQEHVLFHAPLLARKDVPDELIAKVFDYTENLYKIDAIANYRPLLKQFGLTLFRLDRNDCRPALRLYREAVEKGWDRQYRQRVGTGRKTNG